MGFGSCLFGHRAPFIMKAVEAQLERGFEIGPQSEIAGEVAEKLCAFTGMDRATFCNTGSEAVLGALRAARTVTGRNKVAMFTGAYHGIHDEVLVRSMGTGDRRRSFPIAPGIPQEMVENMLVVDYGDPASLDVIREHAHELAAVIVEPVQSRRPDIQPREFLQALRAITRRNPAALSFWTKSSRAFGPTPEALRPGSESAPISRRTARS